jgi:putative peptide maturation dehydrogenase
VLRARRTRYQLFYADDLGFFDIAQLLQGKVQRVGVTQLYAIGILNGREYPITAAELDVLLSIPEKQGIEAESAPTLARLAGMGLVITDSDEPELVRFRELDARLEANGWNVYGALYHSLSRWQDVDAGLREQTSVPEARIEEVTDEFVRRFGPPPPHFHSTSGGRSEHDLPLVRRQTSFYRTLERRRTTRSFKRKASVSERDLATILYYVFGCHGYVAATDEVVGLRKTSPSGGGLHPIEVYPLAMSLDRVEPGLYHYDVERHALEPIAAYSSHEASSRACEFVAGQLYFEDAAAIFVLTARFGRSFWKYRNNERAYGVVLMDVGHLSQTFQLVCAELGLGSFVTAAINAGNIDDELGLDGFDEGALAIVGCGVMSDEETFLEPKFTSYVPRQTAITSAARRGGRRNASDGRAS